MVCVWLEVSALGVVRFSDLSNWFKLAWCAGSRQEGWTAGQVERVKSMRFERSVI